MTLRTLNTEGFLITEIAGAWSLLGTDFGDGYAQALTIDPTEGLRSWTIRVDVLPGDNQGWPVQDDLEPAFVLTDPVSGYVLTEEGDHILLDLASTRASYLWRFFRLSKASGDQPFWIEMEDPATGARVNYLAQFQEDRLSYEVLCARIYGTGLELRERRLPAAAIPVAA